MNNDCDFRNVYIMWFFVRLVANDLDSMVALCVYTHAYCVCLFTASRFLLSSLVSLSHAKRAITYACSLFSLAVFLSMSLFCKKKTNAVIKRPHAVSANFLAKLCGQRMRAEMRFRPTTLTGRALLCFMVKWPWLVKTWDDNLYSLNCTILLKSQIFYREREREKEIGTFPTRIDFILATICCVYSNSKNVWWLKPLLWPWRNKQKTTNWLNV